MFGVLKHWDSIHEAPLEDQTGAIRVTKACNNALSVVFGFGRKPSRNVERPQFVSTVAPNEFFGLRRFRWAVHLSECGDKQSQQHTYLNRRGEHID